MTSTINFNSLVQQIEYTDRALQTNARLVINRHVTAKAWLTGYYIVEYEQKGEDRAKYGEKLIQNLSKQLGAKKFSATTLKIYRQFYVTYPQLSSPIAQFLTKHLAIGQSVTDQLVLTGNQAIKKSQSLTDQFILPATALNYKQPNKL